MTGGGRQEGRAHGGWRGHRRYQRRVRGQLRWRLLLMVEDRLIDWDLLREPRLECEVPAGASTISVFVPVRRGGIELDPGSGRRGLPLAIRVIDPDHVWTPSPRTQVSFCLRRVPMLVLSLSRGDFGGPWRLAAKFRERTLRRAASLGYLRLAPEGGKLARAGRLVSASLTVLVALLHPGRWFRRDRPPQAALTRDFPLLRLSPRLLSSPEFWPTLTMGYLLSPLLCALLVAGLLSALGSGASTVLFGAAAAVAVAAAGTTICGATVSVVAASVGAIPLVTALGLMYGRLLDAGGGAARLLALGPQVPLRQVALGGLPLLVPVSAGAVLFVVTGIFALSFGMAAARASEPPRRPVIRPVAAALVGAVGAGAGPGLVLAGDLLLDGRLPEPWPSLISLGLVGSVALALSLDRPARPPSSRRIPLLAAAAYAILVGLLLPPVIELLAGTLPGLIVVSAGVHVLLQGTFFAAAYLVGERLGGRWAGAWASSLEGALGYVGFLAVSGRVFV